MRVTWGTFKYEIARIVNDKQATKFANDLLACTNDALRLIASVHTGVASIYTIIGDGATASFPVPENAVEAPEGVRIRGIYDTYNEEWLTEVDVLPGNSSYEGYMVWPDGVIKFDPAPTSDREYSVYYVAYFNPIDTDDSVIDVPRWILEAIKLYSAARVLQSPVSQLALLANFRTKVDSGNPTHNPMLDLSKYYMEQFWELLNAHPAPQLERLN